VKPDIFVTVETEIWPNFIRICGERKIKIAMVNGRISPRSFRKYRKTRFFWKKLLGLIDTIGTISQTDARRLEAMGMDPARITVMGNAKYDSLAAKTDQSLKREMAERLNIEPESTVFVAASTHAGEEEIVIGTYKKLRAQYPAMILIIVPRHPERGKEICDLLIREGIFDIITMTDLQRG
jgi:3-deoxy-D-manno-octulosonic-acid transferase